MNEPINWLGGEHVFSLKIGELRALQENCDAGPEEIAKRFYDGTWRVDDLVETIRLGLIGGGMDRAEAMKTINRVVDQHGWLNVKPTAYAVISLALTGPGDDTPGEPEGVETPPENGSSAKSTESPLSLDLPPNKSTE